MVISLCIDVFMSCLVSLVMDVCSLVISLFREVAIVCVMSLCVY